MFFDVYIKCGQLTINSHVFEDLKSYFIMDVTVALIIAIFTLCFAWYIQRKRSFRVLEQMGVPGPEPTSIISGSAGYLNKKGAAIVLDEWVKKYGKTFGYYRGKHAAIVTSDLDLLQHVLIKDYDKFLGREFRFGDRNNVGMLFAIGKTWKRLRTISSPSFTTVQMKKMTPTINRMIDQFMDLIKKRSATNEAINIYDDFQKLTLHVIAACAFGMEMNAFEKPNDPFLKKCQEMFDLGRGDKQTFFSRISFVGYISETLVIILIRIMVKVFRRPRGWFEDLTNRLIEERNKDQANRVDFLQLMLNVVDIPENINDHKLTAGFEDDENVKSSPSDGRVQKAVTTKEVQGQLMLFLLAGFETTSTALGFLSYDLALNPEIQDKLYKEIVEHFSEKVEPDYTSVHNLNYLDLVIKECLRLHPLAQVIIERQCNQTFQYGNLVIRPEMLVKAHVTSIHMDPEHWGPEDPKEFVPERFEPDRVKSRHPLAWMPFGAGPRNCIGLRFAVLEIKLCLVRLLRAYEIVRCEETKIPLPINANLVQGPKEGVYVKLKMRDSS